MKAPVAIEARNVRKSFQVDGISTSVPLKERLLRPRDAHRGRRLDVLRDISFDVAKGEFFGIVGRNGSGKSTLLKLIASIYGADGGSIRIAGKLAPFIELGVGFNKDLPAGDNIVLNGVMMGLTSRQARRRTEEVVEFAGLGDYTDLKLKNYSSGMKVRLGFALMTHVDADVLLIDEVLAVGDAEFQDKCNEVFQRMHKQGRTIVLVSHSMPSINLYCERAMLISNGEIAAMGDTEDVTNRYLAANLKAAAEKHAASVPAVGPAVGSTLSALNDPPVRVEDAWIESPQGKRVERVEPGESITVRAEIVVERPVQGPALFVRIDDARTSVLTLARRPLVESFSSPVNGGTRMSIKARLPNHLGTGRYVMLCGVTRSTEDGEPRLATMLRMVSFEVEGEDGPARGQVQALDYEVKTTPPDRERQALT